MAPQDYASILKSFMLYTDGVAYTDDSIFSRERLAELSVEDVAAWMKNKAYGTPTPTEMD